MNQLEAKHKYSDRVILEELSRICSSKVLKPKYRLCQLLKFLVKESLAGKSEQLTGYNIGIEVFNRDKDFSPELDPIVRIQAGRLRRTLDKYYSSEGKNNSIRFSIPIGNYSPLFIPNLKSDVKLTENSVDTKSTASAKPSILVLPFSNLTGETEQDYFIKGLTEELSIELTRYEDFRVIGFRIKDIIDNDSDSLEKLFSDLGVNFVLQGSVRKENAKIKLSVRLTDTFTHEQLWGEQFKRELSPSNLISIQEDIARETVTIIANEYGVIPSKIAEESRKKAPTELDTYEAILRYFHYQIHHTPETAAAAFAGLEQAVVKEPECGVAIAMLASLYGNKYELDLPGGEEALEKTIKLTDKAIILEPNNQFVRIAYAWRFFIQNQKEKFFFEIEKALALNPNSPFNIGVIGFFMCLYGEWEKGKEILDKAMKHNIGFPSWFYAVTTLYYYREGKFNEAYEEAVKYDIRAIFWGYLLRIAALGQLGRGTEAGEDILALKTLKPDFEIKANKLISQYVKEDELVHKILEGLQKAGLKV